MGEVQKGKSYKSPQRKLVKFFEKSRDQWKAKCRKAKIEVKRLKNRVRFLENSKEHWKSRVKELEAELARVKAAKREEEEEEEELEKLKKECCGTSGFRNLYSGEIPRVETF